MTDIDSMELSDVEAPGWEVAKQKFAQSSRKRLLDMEDVESSKQKVSHTPSPRS